MHIKRKLAALFLVGFMAQPIWAAGEYQDDMAFAFGNAAVSDGLGDVALLSDQEMMETEGHWGLWGAMAGFGVGSWWYGGYLAGGGQPSWTGALKTIGASTFVGAWGGPMASVARYYGASRTGAALSYGISSLESNGW